MERIAVVLLLAGCAAPAAAPPAAAPPETSPPTSLRILPGRVLLEQGESLRFHAVDGEGNPVAVRWSVVQGTSEGPPTYDAGSVTPDGIYRPGVTGYWNHVRADAVAASRVSAMALVQVVPAGGLPVDGGKETRAMAFEALTVEGTSHRIHFPPGLEEDGVRVAGWTGTALRLLRDHYRREVPEGVWTEGRFTVELHPRGGPYAQGSAEISTSWSEGVCTAQVSFLAPSLHDGPGTTAAGLPFGEAYFRKLLVHEFASVALEAATRGKPGGGWTIYEAPPWFVQGLEERLALVLATPDGGKEGLARLRRIARSDAARASLQGGELRLADPYVDGTVFVDFLAARETAAGDGDAIRAVLLSPRPEFAEAFAGIFGSTPADLLPAYRAWLARE
jgi:hypothetical protein